MRTTGEITIRAFAPEDAANLQSIRAEAFAPVFASFRALLAADETSHFGEKRSFTRSE